MQAAPQRRLSHTSRQTLTSFDNHQQSLTRPQLDRSDKETVWCAGNIAQAWFWRSPDPGWEDMKFSTGSSSSSLASDSLSRKSTLCIYMEADPPPAPLCERVSTYLIYFFVVCLFLSRSSSYLAVSLSIVETNTFRDEHAKDADCQRNCRSSCAKKILRLLFSSVHYAFFCCIYIGFCWWCYNSVIILNRDMIITWGLGWSYFVCCIRCVIWLPSAQ